MKILILSASTGGGHMRTSNAVKRICKDIDPSVEVKIIDALEYISPFVNKTVTDGYLQIATKTPYVYGAVYKIADRDNPFFDLVSKVTYLLGKKLVPLIEEYKPDIIITPHAFMTNMAADLKTKGMIDVPVLCIITDFAPHRTYIRDGVDAYVVASNYVRHQLISEYGVDPEKIYPIGIPIDKKFYEKQDKEEMLKELGLRADIPTVLIMAGSLGATEILKVYNEAIETETEFQIIVITGKNKRLYEAFEKLLNKKEAGEIELVLDKYDVEVLPEADDPFVHSISELVDQFKAQIKENIKENSLIQRITKRSSSYKPTKLLYFVDDIEKYMTVSDLIITKPGGLTISEALIMGLPMAIFKGYPGQEEQNAEFLYKNHMAVLLEKGEDGAYQVEMLISDPERLARMKRACLEHSEGKYPEQIYELIKSVIDTYPGKAKAVKRHGLHVRRAERRGRKDMSTI